MSYSGTKPSFISATTSAAMTAGTGLTAPTGDIVATAGNIIATAGNLNLPDSNASGTQGIINFGGGKFLYDFGDANIFLGKNSGNLTLTPGTAVRNIGIGTNSLSSLDGSVSGGDNNIAIGYNCLNAGTTCEGNTIIGNQALTISTGAFNNTAVGYSALNGLLNGQYNIAIGYNAGNGLGANESNNIFIGYDSGGGVNGRIAIGFGSGGPYTTCFIDAIFGKTVGGSGIPVVVDNGGQLGTVVSSIRFKENVKDIQDSSVLELRPVTFTYKTSEDKSKHYGLIAEEVQEVMPDLVVYDDKNQPMSVKYHELPAILLAEIKKLSKRIELLENK